MNLEDLDFEKLHDFLLEKVRIPLMLSQLNGFISHWLVDQGYWEYNHYTADTSVYRREFWQSPAGEDFKKFRDLLPDLGLLLPHGSKEFRSNMGKVFTKPTYLVTPDRTSLPQALYQACPRLTPKQIDQLTPILYDLIENSHMSRSKVIAHMAKVAEVLI